MFSFLMKAPLVMRSRIIVLMTLFYTVLSTLVCPQPAENTLPLIFGGTNAKTEFISLTSDSNLDNHYVGGYTSDTSLHDTST